MQVYRLDVPLIIIMVEQMDCRRLRKKIKVSLYYRRHPHQTQIPNSDIHKTALQTTAHSRQQFSLTITQQIRPGRQGGTDKD